MTYDPAKDHHVITNKRCFEILDWAKKNKWFNDTFVFQMSLKFDYTATQRSAVEKIWKKFIKDEK